MRKYENYTDEQLLRKKEKIQRIIDVCSFNTGLNQTNITMSNQLCFLNAEIIRRKEKQK